METEATTEGLPDETVRVWLVQRTYSDDEQNILILVYATPDGRRYLRKERALTSFGDDRPTTDCSPRGRETATTANNLYPL